MNRLRLAFMGTPDFAVPALRALLDAGHDIVSVYSQPPRPAGRGHRVRPSAVHRFAAEAGLDVRTPNSLRAAEAQATFTDLRLDAAVVAAYGLILPQAILDAPRLGCINIHASLLPRWRGAAPIQRAIMAGDSESGITIMQMDAGLDTGPILLRQAVPITETTTADDLHDRLADLGGKLIVDALEGLAAGRLRPVAQPTEGVTYAAKIGRDEGRLDWRLSAADVERRIRALNPWPGTWFQQDDLRIRVLAAETAGKVTAAPGTVVPSTLRDEGIDRSGDDGTDGIRVVCGDGRSIRLTTVQPAGGRPMTASAFLNGHPLPPGIRLT